MMHQRNSLKSSYATVDNNTAISWESRVQHFPQLGEHADFLRHVSGIMRFRDGSDKATASNYVQISKKN
jgi:hypothetical protein